MNRRSFIAAASGGLVAPGFLMGADKKRRVAVIGHTGRGNYGHGLDTVWLKIPETEIVAVADGDEKGLAKELKKLKVDRGFTDYRKMLAEVRPEFVAVAPRHADQHRDMAMAAIEAGAKGIYIEKPFVRTPGEADELIAAAKASGAKIAVAHRNRYHPALRVIDEMIAKGKLGRLLEIRGRGKGDRRGGGEDLWVLGSHVLNLTVYFAGAPTSCSATMLQDGRPVTAKDVAEGAEGLGPLAGNAVHARYETEKGVIAYYDSIANDDAGGAYSMQLIGSEGVVMIEIDKAPVAHFTPGNPFKPATKPREAIPITTAGLGKKENREELIAELKNHVAAVRDLIAAVDEDRAPVCDAEEGRTTVEMICGVFESQRQGGARVSIPLAERGNALRHL